MHAWGGVCQLTPVKGMLAKRGETCQLASSFPAGCKLAHNILTSSANVHAAVHVYARLLVRLCMCMPCVYV